ncbi:hypothetical protein GN244_ATG00128 [Phytophthora infestans]|uniref:Uncharacterized protein n=1 Tax=Phytophthora infestans TaxID=4787 RepID=A0A833TD49_PHYIN|nr:hypothetical protein GN244_ATG00128 [Phytophthora infestans]
MRFLWEVDVQANMATHRKICGKKICSRRTRLTTAKHTSAIMINPLTSGSSCMCMTVSPP